MNQLVKVPDENTKLFNTLILETSAVCNRTCSFCPNSDFKREEKVMPMEWIEKIVAELKELKFSQSVNLYQYDEPVRNKKLGEIAAMFRKALPKVSIMINTNCDYFKSSEDIAKLIRAGINQMELNIYATGETQSHIDAAKRNEVRVRALVDGLRAEFPVDETLPVYRPIKPNQVAIRVVPKYDYSVANRGAGLQFTTNRAGNIPGYIANLKEPLKKMCVRPFRHLNINFAGDAVLCCQDYYGDTNFGNIATKSLVEIWNDEKFHMYRLKLQNKDRKCFMCDVCDYNGGSYVFAVRPVTFGPEMDKVILNKNYSARETLFTGKSTLQRQIKPATITPTSV